MWQGARDVTPPRRHRVAVLIGVLALGGLVSAAPARAAASSSAGPCTTTAGITVIVDFGSAGGGVQARCAPGPVANGFDALTKAGFSIRNVSSQPGFLCQIDGQPADDPCTHVPSAARYWAYWYAARGEPWTYSSSGASRTPAPGSVEGWSFGDGDPPGVLPPAPIAATTTRPSPPTTSTVTVTTAPPATGTDTTPSTRADGTTTSSTRVDEVGAAGGPGDGEQAADLVAPASSDDETGGSPTGTLVGIAIVLAVGGTGAVAARHRRADELGH